jgi:para-aminobenzoate synthetase component 1
VSQLPVVERRSWIEPCERFEEFARKPFCVWLDTPQTTEGISILAAEPAKIFRAKGRVIEIISPGGSIRLEGNPFDALNEQIAACHLEGEAPAEPFPLGAAIGYFGYDLKNFVERLPDNVEDDVGLPDCWFGFYDNLLVFDHAQQRVWQISRPTRAVSQHSNTPTLHRSTSALRSNFTRDSYRRAVLRAKEYIAAGDIYQVNLSQRFQCAVDSAPTDLYHALRKVNPAPYCAYLDIGDAQILSSSPECFLKICDRHVVTRPIKGTRPRDRDANELLQSPKDNAELVMITDLERNDFGRVCQFGSVRVSELVRVESYATVHHLVSTVEGLLRRDVSHVDCVRACFPGGSITGAPKIRAMEIIDELEPHARGVYTGAIGFLGFNGLTHLNVAIRTAVYQSGRLTFHAGGGIVADSEPDAEYDETLAKAQGIFNAIDQLRLRQRPVHA